MEPVANAKGVGLLLEREDELEALRNALERLTEGDGSTVLVEGPAGIGKTRLLGEAADLAAEAPVLVRTARAGQLEREMQFGVARQLLEPLIERAGEEERSRLLAGSAASSLVALGRTGPGEPDTEVDALAAVHGLYWLVANLAESQPVVLVVDDVQWADGQSLRWLDFVARRASDTGVLVVASARTGEADEPPELESLRVDASSAIHPSPLSGEAVEELVAAALGAEAPEGLSAACSTATGGNPFLLAELLRALRSSPTELATTIAEDAAALGTETLARSVRRRIEPFGEDAAELAAAVAVLGSAPQLGHASALARIDENRARELCDQLRDAEILAPGHPIEFVHPLVRAAVHGEISEESLSDAHRRAAELLSTTDGFALEAAAHLLKCAPNSDPWVVRCLREAAREAMAAGAPDAARRYLERALAEPPADDVVVSFEFGHALRGASPYEAPGVLVSVAERAEDPELRLRAIGDAARAYTDCGNLEQGVHWTRRLIEAIPANRTERLLAAEAQLYCLAALDAGRRPEDSARIAAIAKRSGATSRGELMVRQALSCDRAAAGAPVGEVVDLAYSPSPLAFARQGVVQALTCKALIWSGEWDLAREAAVRGWGSASSTGIVHTSSYGEAYLAEIDRLAGRLVDSEAHARTAWDIVADLAPASAPAWAAITNLLATLIARGELDEAGELAGRWDLSAPLSVVPTGPTPLEVRGTLKLAQGELDGGVTDLIALGEDMEEMGFLNPAACPWRQEVVPALSALGRSAEAKQIITEGEERARAFGAPHVIGAMLRARSSIEAKRRRVDTLNESITILEEARSPYELARSQLELGAVLRRDGQRSKSREPLRAALELATSCGARGLAERSREELAAAGSRPRSLFRTGVEALTASELRTARMASAGLSNVEIAQQLFVTRKTVEKHLSNAYAKLEISSRKELPEALSRS